MENNTDTHESNLGASSSSTSTTILSKEDSSIVQSGEISSKNEKELNSQENHSSSNALSGSENPNLDSSTAPSNATGCDKEKSGEATNPSSQVPELEKSGKDSFEDIEEKIIPKKSWTTGKTLVPEHGKPKQTSLSSENEDPKNDDARNQLDKDENKTEQVADEKLKATIGKLTGQDDSAQPPLKA